MRRLAEIRDRTARTLAPRNRREDGGSLGDILEKMHAARKLTPEQIHAASKLVDLVTKGHGGSGTLVPRYGERVVSNGRVVSAPATYATAAHQEWERAMRHLRAHERVLLNALITNREAKRGGVEGIGLTLYGVTNAPQARAEVHARIKALLSTLAEIWPLKVPRSA
jgi:hypothetical protein